MFLDAHGVVETADVSTFHHVNRRFRFPSKYLLNFWNDLSRSKPEKLNGHASHYDRFTDGDDNKALKSRSDNVTS